MLVKDASVLSTQTIIHVNTISPIYTFLYYLPVEPPRGLDPYGILIKQQQTSSVLYAVYSIPTSFSVPRSRSLQTNMGCHQKFPTMRECSLLEDMRRQGE